MSAVKAIAVHVFRESVRDRVLYNLVVFAVLMISASYLVGLLSAGQEVKIIKDLSLAATAAVSIPSSPSQFVVMRSFWGSMSVWCSPWPSIWR